MDKRILDVLIKFGLVTNTCVDPEKYADVDDLINKGVVTVPGAKSKIMELLEKANIEAMVVTEDVKMPLPETIVEVKEDEPVTITDTPEDVAPIDETPKSPEVIVETPVEEAPIEEVPVEEPTVVEEVVETPVEEPTVVEEVVETVEEVVETPTEETPVEESVETTEEAPKKKKSTKKAEQAE